MEENAMGTTCNIAHFRNIQANDICRDVDIYSALTKIPNSYIETLLITDSLQKPQNKLSVRKYHDANAHFRFGIHTEDLCGVKHYSRGHQLRSH
jgi:hypothetical protein